MVPGHGKPYDHCRAFQTAENIAYYLYHQVESESK